ncbi:MAG: YcjX family protein [Alphaproteobacteria bacterium]
MFNKLNPFQQHLRIGVTGLSHSGKTIFLTSLIHNLLHQKKLPLFSSLQEGIIEAVTLQHQPNDSLPRFTYEQHLDNLLSSPPQWPESTKNISQIRLAIRYRPQNILARQFGSTQVLTLDIIDYPGEWLLDLPLLETDFFSWSQNAFKSAKGSIRKKYAQKWLNMVASIDPTQPADERLLSQLAKNYTQYLLDIRKNYNGYFDLPPGRFLLPGDLKDAPVLTFCPLEIKEDVKYPKNSYGYVMQRRFESYKKLVVKPFFEDYFAKLDQQVVLIDPLTTLNHGMDALNDLSHSMETILDILKPKIHSWLYRLLLGRPMSHILFAATKADHVHHTQHNNLLKLTQSLIPRAYQHSNFTSSHIKIMAIASLRASSELSHKDGRKLISGRLEDGTEAAIYPGEVPTSARQALEYEYGFKSLAPPIIKDEQEGFEHIRLDQAIDFLLKDIIR